MIESFQTMGSLTGSTAVAAKKRERAPYALSAEEVLAQFAVDAEKAALNGISPAEVSDALRLAVGGMPLGLLHRPEAREDIPIVAQFGRAERSSRTRLQEIQIAGNGGVSIPLGELVRVKETVVDRSIYHKNLMPVVYVTGDVAGAEESPLYPILAMNRAIDELELPEGMARLLL